MQTQINQTSEKVIYKKSFYAGVFALTRKLFMF